MASFSSSIGIGAAALLACLPSALWSQSLRGRVVDRASLSQDPLGRGVVKAKLALHTSAGKRLFAKPSGKGGAFLFTKLPEGQYVLTAAMTGYLDPAPFVFEVKAGDTLERVVALDRLPQNQGMPARVVGKTKSFAGFDYYVQLAEGMLRSAQYPALNREATRGPATLSRFFDAEDTTAEYRELWSALLWAEAERRAWPYESRVYLAHAVDSVFPAAGWPVPSAAKPLAKVDADSVEALSSRIRDMILTPNPKVKPAALAKSKLPRAVVLEVLESRLQSTLPLPKKRAFTAKLRPVFGVATAKKLAALYEPKKGKSAKAAPPAPDGEWLWQVAARNAVGKKPNPVAQYHLARRDWEDGKAREASTVLKKVLSARPGYDAARWTLARCHLDLKDEAAATAAFEALAGSESPGWKARAAHGLAMAHWKAGRAAEAEKELWKSLGLDANSDDSRQGLFLLAEIAVARDATGAASSTSVEDLLKSLLKIRPQESEAHYWLGRLARKGGQEGVALDHFRRATGISPHRVEFAEDLAASYHAVDECPAALRALRPVSASLTSKGLEVYGECLLEQGKTAEAVKELERRYLEKPSAAALALWIKAMAASGKAADAAREAERAKEFSDPLVRRALAEARLALNEPAVARRLLTSLAAGNTQDPELRFLLGRCAFLERDYNSAYKEFSAALGIKADYPEVLEAQGQVLLKTGRASEAHVYFRDLADRDGPWKAKGFLGEGMAFFQENKDEAAESNLRRSYKISPSADAAAHLALALIKQGKTQEAGVWIQNARKLDPGHPLMLMARVDWLAAKNDEAGAVELAEVELDKNPESCEHLLVAAKANYRAGLDERTKDLSEKANRICPLEPGSHFYLGAVSARSGAVAEARRHFNAYVQAGGDAQRIPENYR